MPAAFIKDLMGHHDHFVEQEQPVDPSQIKILIVEDEPDTAEMFAEMMRMSGYQIFKAYNGASAVALIKAEKPAAVVLDLMMPDLSGLDVLRFVRGDKVLARIPIIVVSAKSLPSDIKDGLEAGASVYLTKPVGYLDLKAAVENAIRETEMKTAGK